MVYMMPLAYIKNSI